jgi:hypothetical protein
MTKQNKRQLNFLTPLVVMGVAWAIKKSARKTQTVVEKKRPSDQPKAKHEELAWKVGLAVALASAEALINTLMSKSVETVDEELIEKTD